MSLNSPEPPPQANDTRPIWEMVVADMQARDMAGAEKYGTRLQAFNGRKPLVDAYQELLDLIVYLRQEIEERRTIPITVEDLLLCICDPGAFTPRADNYTESIPMWGARAIVVFLKERGIYVIQQGDSSGEPRA